MRSFFNSNFPALLILGTNKDVFKKTKHDIHYTFLTNSSSSVPRNHVIRI